MLCPNCGATVSDSSRFCEQCGAPLAARTPAVNPVQPAAPVQAQPPLRYQQPAPIPFDFSRIPVRYRCPNDHVYDAGEGETVCRTCGAPLPTGGYIQLYRMGNYMGCAVGMGVYIDDAPCGHLANKQSIRISVPYGNHKVHVTHTTTRKCNDPIFTVTPEYPYVWCKAHFSKAGFAITVEQANPQDMPNK